MVTREICYFEVGEIKNLSVRIMTDLIFFGLQHLYLRILDLLIWESIME